MRNVGHKQVQEEKPLQPEMQAAILTAPADQQRIGVEDILKAAEVLNEYKRGKANLEKRIVEDELWWELRHWEALRHRSGSNLEHKPTSAWLVNAVMNKHADAMDNAPEPVVLPRERDDE
jgi:hypothetical protein